MIQRVWSGTEAAESPKQDAQSVCPENCTNYVLHLSIGQCLTSFATSYYSSKQTTLHYRMICNEPFVRNNQNCPAAEYVSSRIMQHSNILYGQSLLQIKEREVPENLHSSLFLYLILCEFLYSYSSADSATIDRRILICRWHPKCCHKCVMLLQYMSLLLHCNLSSKSHEGEGVGYVQYSADNDMLGHIIYVHMLCLKFILITYRKLKKFPSYLSFIQCIISEVMLIQT